MFKKITKIVNRSSLFDLIAFLSGFLLPLSLSPFNYYPLVFISILGLLYSIYDCSSKKAAWRGYLYGLSSFGFGVSWVYISIHEHGNASTFLAFCLTLLFIAVLAIFPALKILVFKKQTVQSNLLKNSNNINLLILAPSIWVVFDWLQGWIFTGFPWLYIGYSQTNTTLAGYAPIVSIFGLSWITFFVSSLLFLIIKYFYYFFKNNRDQSAANSLLTYIVTISIVFIIGNSLSGIQWTTKDARNKSNLEKIILVQGNIPQENRWRTSELTENIYQYIKLTTPYWQHATIIWPESAVPLPLHRINNFLEDWTTLTKNNNSTLIFGAPILASYTKQQYYNGLIAIHNTRTMTQYYKNKLVPWGEYVPLESVFRGLIAFFDLPMSNFISGVSNNLPFNIIQSEYIKWVPFICYEIAYPKYVISHAYLGNAIVTVSNDAWFGNSIGPWQHLQLAQMRALETGRPVVRATNNGITAVIDTRGKILNQIPQFQTGVLVSEIQGYSGSTPIMSLGVNSIILICFLIIILFSYFKRRNHY